METKAKIKCPRCKGWGSVETGRVIPGEPGSRAARICRACNGSGEKS